MRDGQQGTDDVLLARLHANHAGEAPSTQQVEQQRLHLIVSMMSHSDGLAMGKLSQEAIASLPRCLFQRAMLLACQRRDIYLSNSHGQSPFARDMHHGLSFRVRLLPQLVVEVRNM